LSETTDVEGLQEEPETLLDKDEDVQDINPFSETLSYPYAITSFGADFLVDGLVTRLSKGDIVVPTFDPEIAVETGVVGFQRQFLWNRTQMDRFVESLLLGLPIPGIFLVSEPNNILLVLDGHQRLRTLQDYYGGVTRGREYRLGSIVQEQFRGLRYRDLDDGDRRRLDNTVIHATIVKQEEPKEEDQSSIYLIFERLNTGGTILQPQEIRVALYRGELVNLLRTLNNNESWRILYGPPSRRLKDQELILRFFAFLYRAGEYKRPMQDFLNKYMELNRDLQWQDAAQLRKVFDSTCHVLAGAVGSRAFRPVGPVNAAVVDSVMYGVAKRLDGGPIENVSGFKAAHEGLISDRDYLELVDRSTAQEDNVAARLRQAEQAFAAVE
jgi:Protein of unknown function DUF262